jgi:hypothetical protein
VVANGVTPLVLGLSFLSIGVGSWFGWLKVRWLTIELFHKSNEMGFIILGSIFAVIGVVRLL